MKRWMLAAVVAAVIFMMAFAGAITGSDAPSVSYATVYPLVMLLRVLTGQLIVNLFFLT